MAEQNKRLDFYGRRAGGAKGLIPAGIEMADEENGLEAIASVLAEDAEDAASLESTEDNPAPVAALRR